MQLRYIVIFISLVAFTDAVAKPLAQWVQLGPEGRAQVRAIVAADEPCPHVRIDGDYKQRMLLRAKARKKYNVNSCELTLPKETQSVAMGKQQLPLPVAKPQRILVIGDTGCRIKGFAVQACNDDGQWPLKKIAKQAAKWKPDLIIHVGDFLYREVACPSKKKGCTGSPHGQAWATWDADFFQPIRALSKSAPWVFTRGNHENCKRAGAGWFRFLDPYTYQAKCTDFMPPYRVNFENLNLIVFDSSGTKYRRDRKQQDIYSEQFDQVNALATENTWLVTHQPLWAAFKKLGITISTNVVLQSVFEEQHLSDKVQLVLSGHFHEAGIFSFSHPNAEFGARPPQIISGNGGTQLHPKVEFAKFVGQDLGGMPIADGFNLFKHGYATVTPIQGGWRWQFRDENAKIEKTCDIINKVSRCKPGMESVKDAQG